MTDKTPAANEDQSHPIPDGAKANGGDENPIDVGPMSPTEKPVEKPKETAAAKPTPPKEHKPPDDALDLDSLWLDPSLGDGLVDTHHHSCLIGKPKNFFRVNPDPAYRRRTEIYVHKVDGVIDEQYFIMGPKMRGRFEEATPCTLVTTIYRDGTLRLWALKLPKGGGHDNQAWITARSSARTGMDKWVKLVWVGGAYQTRDAQSGYAPDPDWSKAPSFDDLIRLAFGGHGIIHDENHPIARDLLGAKPKGEDDDGLS
jgi:hypothetical protein